jgi:hypothetical protein
MFANKKTNKILFLTDAKKKIPFDKSGKEKLKKKDPPRAKYFLLSRWGGTLLLILALTLLLAPDFQLPVTDMMLGDVSPFNIKAKKDFLLEDALSTEKNREVARNSTLPVYDFDAKLLESRLALVQKTFQRMEEFYSSQIPRFYEGLNEIRTVLKAPEEEYSTEKKNEKRIRKMELDDAASRLRAIPVFEDREKEFFGNFKGKEINQTISKTLRWHHYHPDIRKGLSGLLARVYSNGVVGNRESLQSLGKNGITIRNIDSGEEKNVPNADNIVDMEGLTDYLGRYVSDFIDPEHKSLQKVVIKIAAELMEPNLTFNKQETELRKDKAGKAVKPVFFNIKNGEMIVREGEKIGETQLQKLIGINKESNLQEYILSLVGLFIFTSLTFFLAWTYLLKHRQDFVLKGHNLLLLGSLILSNFLIFRLLVHFSQPVATYLNVGVESIYFAIPFAAAPMFTVLLFDMDIGILVAIINFALVGVHLEWRLGYALMALIGGLFSVLRKNYYKQRSAILKNGLFIGLLNVVMIVPLDLMEHTLASNKGVADLASGFVGGIMATLVVSWLLPAFESLFHISSDIKLQEISNLNHPLLRNMIMEAPGTYHHSIVVSTLAEGAAEVVGANPLLVRVGAYYHDIGKMKKPQYFIENQKEGKNKHDKLAPSMSALIVASHVKDGVELAKIHKLNPLIIDFIRQHHGMSLMRYFYNKAKEQENPEVHTIEEASYRYPGPKPQTKEAAIVLLADCVEAAARSLPEPSVSRLQSLVEKIISHKLIERELEECDLTLKDLNRIGKVFVRILTGIFHSRIEYPEKREEKEWKDKKGGDSTIGNRASQPQEKKGTANKEIASPGQGNIKKFKLSG